MTEITEQGEVETAAGEENSKPSKLVLKSGLVLLATGALVAVGANMRRKIDLAGMRKRLLPEKWLFSTSDDEEAMVAQEQQEVELVAAVEESDGTPVATE